MSDKDNRNFLGLNRGPRGGMPARGGTQGYTQVPPRPSPDHGRPQPQPQPQFGTTPSPHHGGAPNVPRPLYGTTPSLHHGGTPNPSRPGGNSMPPPRTDPPTATAGPAVKLKPTATFLDKVYPEYSDLNICAVSPIDFPSDPPGKNIYLCFKNKHGRCCVFSACPIGGVQQGAILMNRSQRTWSQVSNFETLEVERYSEQPPLLGSIDLEVSKSPSAQIKTYDHDHLEMHFRKTYEGQILAPGQEITMEYETSRLKITVKTVQLTNLGGGEQSHASERTVDPEARGMLVPSIIGDTHFPDINFYAEPSAPIKLVGGSMQSSKNAIIRPDFKFESMGIGGLDNEFSTIFRRAFASRIFPPALVEQMGISHVKGILLYGPPGTGKTLIAREIGKMLNAREPKVINGPEILNKYVGQSEENVRNMFKDAEEDYKRNGEESDLHIIIFDELDAVCKQRGSGTGGTGVGDSVVNQLLSKLDGVNQLNNILLIGMTNRKDMIDDALLRPGRLEVHVEISLPDEHGRIQILKIHTSKMRGSNRVSDDVSLEELARLTKNFSGAEIAGLVKAAVSYSFNRHTKLGDERISGNPKDVMLTRDDFMSALDDVKPAFGVSEEELTRATPYGIIDFSPHIQSILTTGLSFVEAVRASKKLSLFSVLVHGPYGAGKTALAAEIGLKSEFPFVKIIRPMDLGTSEVAKLEGLRRAFADAYKSALSFVILDSLEKIIEWNPIGPRFSNAVVQYLGAVLENPPPKGRRLLIMATTSQRSMLNQHGVFEFDREIAVPAVKDLHELQDLLEASGRFNGPDDVDTTLRELQSITGADEVGIGVKAIFSALETAAVREPFPVSLAEDISSIMAVRNAVF
ncbi:P-loop containing nucleoside triphosphate hydrolase protein [Camillea tinctor]|nr:P-loop containing nucleoside triphosphate hydrolase protein [Camillea tinctor]